MAGLCVARCCSQYICMRTSAICSLIVRANCRLTAYVRSPLPRLQFGQGLPLAFYPAATLGPSVCCIYPAAPAAPGSSGSSGSSSGSAGVMMKAMFHAVTWKQWDAAAAKAGGGNVL